MTSRHRLCFEVFGGDTVVLYRTVRGGFLDSRSNVPFLLCCVTVYLFYSFVSSFSLLAL